MVVLSKIYICIGDKGMIVFGNGDRVVKYDVCVLVYGISDELNLYVGVVRLYVDGVMDKWLFLI